MTAPAERRVRIGDWLVPYDDATQEVTIHRSIGDILRATPGDHADCMNTRCIMAQRREHAFPHPVLLVSTTKSRVYVVDRLTDTGEPAHAIRYELSERDSRLIGEHDKYAIGEPGELRLRVPRLPKGTDKTGGRKTGGNTGKYQGKRPRPITSVGAAARFKVAVGALHEVPQTDGPVSRRGSEPGPSLPLEGEPPCS